MYIATGDRAVRAYLAVEQFFGLVKFDHSFLKWSCPFGLEYTLVFACY